MRLKTHQGDLEAIAEEIGDTQPLALAFVKDPAGKFAGLFHEAAALPFAPGVRFAITSNAEVAAEWFPAGGWMPFRVLILSTWIERQEVPLDAGSAEEVSRFIGMHAPQFVMPLAFEPNDKGKSLAAEQWQEQVSKYLFMVLLSPMIFQA